MSDSWEHKPKEQSSKANKAKPASEWLISDELDAEVKEEPWPQKAPSIFENIPIAESRDVPSLNSDNFNGIGSQFSEATLSYQSEWFHSYEDSGETQEGPLQLQLTVDQKSLYEWHSSRSKTKIESFLEQLSDLESELNQGLKNIFNQGTKAL